MIAESFPNVNLAYAQPGVSFDKAHAKPVLEDSCVMDSVQPVHFSPCQGWQSCIYSKLWILNSFGRIPGNILDVATLIDTSPDARVNHIGRVLLLFRARVAVLSHALNDVSCFLASNAKLSPWYQVDKLQHEFIWAEQRVRSFRRCERPRVALEYS